MLDWNISEGSFVCHDGGVATVALRSTTHYDTTTDCCTVDFVFSVFFVGLKLPSAACLWYYNSTFVGTSGTPTCYVNNRRSPKNDPK